MINFECMDDKYIRNIFLGIALILKRNDISSIERLSKFTNIKEQNLLLELIKSLKDIYTVFTEQNKIETINEILKYDEKDIVKCILKEEILKSYQDYSTPKTLCELIDKLLNIKDNTKILDLYSGEGKIDEIILDNHKNIEIDGYEINEKSILIAKVKMYALRKKVCYLKKDVFVEKFEEEKYDYAVADIPLISKFDKHIQESLNLTYKKLKLNIENRISTTWLTAIKILNSLKPGGKAVITTVQGSLFNVLDKEVRKQLIDRGYIEAVVSLPKKLLRFTGIDISIIIVSKQRNKSIKFIDLEKCFVREGIVNSIDVDKAIQELKNNCLMIDYKDIVKKDYSLNIKYYTETFEILDGKILREVTEDIFRGYQITSSEVNKMLVDTEEEMNYKVLEISNIDNDGKIDFENIRKINSKDKNLDRYLLKDGYILISARGDKIKKCIIKIANEDRIIANGSINVIRVNKEKMEPLYLKMFFDSEKGDLTLENIKTGITIPSINIGVLQKILVSCPPLEKQKEFAEKYKLKLDIIQSTTKRLEKLKDELKNLANLI